MRGLKINVVKVKLLQFPLICRRVIAVGAWGRSGVQIFIYDNAIEETICSQAPQGKSDIRRIVQFVLNF